MCKCFRNLTGWLECLACNLIILVVLQSMEDRVSFVKEMHMLKTDIFMKLIEEGRLPLRPGVKRIISVFSISRKPVRYCALHNMCTAYNACGNMHARLFPIALFAGVM